MKMTASAKKKRELVQQHKQVFKTITKLAIEIEKLRNSPHNPMNGNTWIENHACSLMNQLYCTYENIVEEVSRSR